MREHAGSHGAGEAYAWALAWRGDGRDHSLAIAGRLRIGRSPDNDIVLADGQVAPQHCLLAVDPAGQLVIQDLGAAHGVYVNDRRLAGPAALRPDDIVRVGQTLFRVWYVPRQVLGADDGAGAGERPGRDPTGDGNGARRGSARAAWLEQGAGERWYLDEETLIGRKEGNDIRLADRSVSRYHALVRLVDGQYVLSDLGSANGTFVDDRALYAPQALRPGERVRFGETEFVFGDADGRAAPAAPGRAPAIESSQTAHFRLHYARDSFAAQQLPAVSDRLERVYAVVVETLGLDPQGLPPIEVYLAEWLADPRQPGTPLASGGYVASDRPAIHEVYGVDAPGEDLERSLIAVLLALAAGGAFVRAWPPMLVEALRVHAFQRLGAVPPPEQVLPALAAAKEQGQLPALAQLLAGPTLPEDDVARLAAATFLAHLARTHGAGPLRQFLTGFDARDPDAAARAAYGRPLRQLERSWHKGLTAAPPGGIPRFLKLSLGYLRPHALKVAEIVVYLALIVAFGIALAKLQGLLLDEALIPGNLGALARIMGVLVAAFIVVLLASLRQHYLTAWVSESVLRDLRLRMFANIQRLHPGYFQQVQTGDILSRLTSDLAAVEYGLTGALAQGLQMLLTLVAALVTIFFTDWKLALVAIVGLPLFFITGRYLGPAAAQASAARQQHLAEVTSAAQENLGAQSVVKAFGLQGRATRDFTAALDTLFRSSLRLTFLVGIFGVSASSIASAINLTVLGVGAWLVIGGNLTAGTLFAFLALMGQIIGPVQSISAILQALQQASGAMDRVEELLRAEPAIQDRPGARAIGPLSRAIRFEGVTFGYDEAQPILRGLDLAIPAGASVALVGPSGCGKSTILNQILRFYEPQAGRVTFDGVDLREATLESLRGQLGVVFQDNILFNSSVRENIRMGRPEATDAEVEAAARAAEIHDLVAGLPEGYDTVVGERGGRLSGGQRQRVALARAIIRNPAVLLLDEATSALDPQTEAAINETLARLARGRTTISVTHRLASVVRADQVYVFDQGRLVEQGTHDELVRRGGLYARLWREQHGAIAGAQGPRLAVEAARLQRVPLFAALSPELLDALARQLNLERHDPGTAIVTAGQVGDKLYVVDRGQVDVVVPDPAGGERTLATLGEGKHFGEIALLYDRPRGATVRARTAVQLYSLAKVDFQGLLAAVPQLREVLERTIAERQRAAEAQLSAAR